MVFMKGIMCLVVALAIHEASSSSQKGDGSCSLSPQAMEQAVISCMVHEPLLMVQMAEHMSDSDSQKLDFFCSHEDAMVTMLMCLEEKVKKCLPSQSAQILTDLMPDHAHMTAGVKLMCSSKKLLTDSCMNQQVTQSFMMCYTGQLQSLLSSSALTSKANIKSAFCRIIAADEACFNLHHGSCSKDYVKAVSDLLRAFFPTEDCPAGNSDPKLLKKSEMRNALESIISGGTPLRFQKERNNINNNFPHFK